MSQQLDILKREFERLSEDLTKKYDELGMRASGRWDKEKTVEASENGTVVSAKIIGEKYTEQLQYGRNPTKGGGGQGESLRDKIEQWIKDKGIQSELPIRSLAFLIARKIHKEGWKRSRYGGVNLIELVVTSERIDNIISKVGIINVKGIVSGLVSKFKTV